VTPSLLPAGTFRYSPTHGWLVSARPSRYSPISWYRVSQEVLFVAAADHCLAAAYRGGCPGVDPDEFMRWRAETRARHQGRPVQAVLEDIARARKALAHAPRILIGGVPVVDLRGQEVPELPEAAARDGTPFLATPGPGPGPAGRWSSSAHRRRHFRPGPSGPPGTASPTCTAATPKRAFAGGYLA
jgi:hypothetical protein